MSSIKERGLLVPGTEGRDVRVAHGTAMGNGIYLARNPLVSAGYSPDNRMLACAVILGKCFVGHGNRTMEYHSNSNQDGSIMVISTGAQVLPLFVVTYAPTTATPPVTRIIVKKNKIKKKP